MSKKWRFLPKIGDDFKSQFPQINEVILQLFYNRGLKAPAEIDDFLNVDYEEGILNPYLFKAMGKAVERVFEAVAKKEKVMIYGDYDADGVCATTILLQTLKSLGLAVDSYIPFRETEGYGLNLTVAKQIISQEFNLVLTVDCGVANAEEIALLRTGGVETIVLDHHQEPPARPGALAIINPSLSDSGYPFKHLCGAGVVLKFVQALMLHQEEKNSPIKLPVGFDKWFLDLVAIATVGDIVPLTRENRVLVKYGLLVLEKTKRIGLLKLIETINNKSGVMDSQYLGWRLVPRLNAAGRVNHASVALNLLTAKDESEAERLVQILERNNQERQLITDKILKEAEAQLGLPDMPDGKSRLAGEVKDQKILWAIGEGWPAGVVGLVAGKICDKFHRPAIIFTRAGDKYTGSGRSIEEFDITEALKNCNSYLARFGGHSQACGLTVIGEKNLKRLQEQLTIIANEQLKAVDLSPGLTIEAEIKLQDINWEFWEELKKFEPYGEENEKPVFALKGLKVERVEAVGQNGKHLRLMASQDDPATAISSDWQKLIGFSFGGWCQKLKIGDKIDAAFELDVNEWNGSRELQLKIIDLKLSDKI